MKRLVSTPTFVALICLTVFAATADAQWLKGRILRPIFQSQFDVEPNPPGDSTDFNQCQNGKKNVIGDPPTENTCPESAFTGGALTKNNSHYIEGDSVPYQVVYTGTANSLGNTITIEWDSIKGGIHALDYLTNYNLTETLADPCTGVPSANCAAFTTGAIPDNPAIPNTFETSGQLFTMWGGTITGVSGYTVTGDALNASTSITITFNLGATGVAVLAFAGHPAERADWGPTDGAVNISGSPYHLTANGGSQLQVSIGALTAVATVNITKLVKNLIPGPNEFQNPLATFNFTSNGGPLGNFSLVDADPTENGGQTQSANTTTFTQFTVTEAFTAPYNVTGASGCVIDPGTFANTSTASINPATRVATITPGEGNTITCTFINSPGGTTAAHVTVSGRVYSSTGRAISNVKVSLMDDMGGYRYTTSSSLGYYSFNDVEVGRAYVLNGVSSRYAFQPRFITLSDTMANLNLVAY